MLAMTDVSGQAAHVLLDLLASYDPEASKEVNDLAAATAFERLNEIGAVTLDVHGDGTRTVNMSGLLDAFATVGGLLVSELASQRRKDPLFVIAALRSNL